VGAAFSRECKPWGRLAKLQILDGMLNPEALLAAMKIYQGLWLDLKPKA